MTDNINHPAHYTRGFETRPIECIDITQYMGFCNGNAFKYVWRAGKKGGREQMIEDLKKARWYLERMSYAGVVRGDSNRAKAVFRMVASPLEYEPRDGWTERKRYEILWNIVLGFAHEARMLLAPFVGEDDHAATTAKMMFENNN